MTTPPTIGVIGANSQVASEVSTILSLMPSVRVVPIVRSENAAWFLRRLGLSPRVGSVTGPDASALLEGCTTIVDFSLPSGSMAETREAIRNTIRGTCANAPSARAYIYVSTTIAFGMPSHIGHYKSYLLARTRYAADKRYAERFARKIGRAHGLPVYIVRLGQVYGELQKSTFSLRQIVAQGRPIALPNGGQSPGDAVFCTTIALAIANIARGLESAGLYTLVETPDLSHQQLLDGIAATLGRTVDIRRSPETPKASFFRSLVGIGRAAVGRAFAASRETLAAHVPLSRKTELRIKARLAARRIRRETAGAELSNTIVLAATVGPVPGRRLASLSRNRDEMLAASEALGRRLAGVLKSPRDWSHSGDARS
jgi:nucleoside-diphosphate-sugar epimerase